MAGKEPPGIPLEAWLKELQTLTANSSNDDGFSAQEIADKLGMTVQTVRIKLRPLAKQGKIKVGRRADTRIDGRPCEVPVYRPVMEMPPPKEKRSRKKKRSRK
jgi:predicted transcriptional regulator